MAATALVLLNGGFRSLGIVLFLPLIVCAACVLGERVAWCAVGVFLAMTLAFAVAEQVRGPLPAYFPGDPIAIWGILLLAGALLTAPLIRVITALENAVTLMRKRADEMAQLDGALREANEALAAELRERTRSEQEVRALSARLINAQEAERTRIARELHDNFSQQIAVVSIATSNLKMRLPAELEEAVAQSGRIQQTLTSLGEGVRRLSHELHPAVLQYSGLEAALGNYCAEFAALTAHRIAFSTEGVFDDVSPEVSLCVYRVAQEALQNSIKHARVDEAEVALKREGDALCLTASDRGVGMDASAAGGLGLVSIRERTRLVNGRLEIKSCPGAGVTIALTVPLAGREEAAVPAP